MSFKSASRAVIGYTIYAIISTIVEITVLLAIVLWGLPYVGIHLPIWGLVILVVIFLGYSYYTYHMGRKALNNKLMHDMEAMIGYVGIVATPLEHTGYIKVRGELWQATSEFQLDIGDEVIIAAIEGFKLRVVPKEKYQAGQLSARLD